jgi:hypothetical protein
MWHDWKLDTSFLQMLLIIDEQLLAETRRQLGNTCRYCGGPLHRGDYPRKPRGLPDELEALYATRFSLCCGWRDCRRRVTPPSVRFLGRKVYVGALVFLAVLRLVITGTRRLADRVLGVPGKTVRRWSRWWRGGFCESDWWRVQRGRFAPAVDTGKLPLSLLERFAGQGEAEKLKRALLFVAPITTTTASFVRVESVTQKMAFDSMGSEPLR